MKRCSAKPYEGEESYIFVSYCHRDKAKVFPVVEQLARDGYRVWYDEGIDPGSEWPEIIARHLNGSAICLAFISENSLNSHNCRREINFALLKKKFFISVVLEQVQMSLGMEMQLSSSQSIFKYTLDSEEEFFAKLYTADELKSCKGERNESIRVSSYEEYALESLPSGGARKTFSDKWFVSGDEEAKQVEPEPAESCDAPGEPVEQDDCEMDYQEAEENHSIPEEFPREAEEVPNTPEEEPQEAQPQGAPEDIADRQESDPEQEESPAKEPEKEIVLTHILMREKTGEEIIIDKARFVIGRSESIADYVIRDNRSVSRTHTILNLADDVCYVTDNKSLNKTFLNSEALEPDKRYKLSDGDVVRVYNEKFIYRASKDQN